jgi:hypothetical protein
MGTKRIGWARIKSLVNENTNTLQFKYPGYVTVTADTTLTAADSGKIILFGPAAAGLASDTTVSLPSAAAGLYYMLRYWGGAADAHDLQIDTGSDTNYFIGGIAQKDSQDGGDDTIVYHPNLSSNSIVNFLVPDSGTWCELWCDGTNWFLNGFLVGTTDTGITWADQ